MLALTVQQPWAEMIASGRKQLEHRSWRTHHRGPVAICSAAFPDTSEIALMWRRELSQLTLPTGVAVCVVDIVSCSPNERRGGYSWALAHPRRLEPLHVRGRLGLWPVSIDLVREIKHHHTA